LVVRSKELNLKDYSVCFGNAKTLLSKFLSDTKYSMFFVLVDENTKTHCLPLISEAVSGFEVIEITSGEVNKNLETCNLIWNKLIEKNAGRNTLLINLGGGVIGDMGGFCAAVYKRGIDFLQIPTTLLSQVDASVGGKLGIDFNLIKNCIGVFRNPLQVIIDSDFLSTLPKREFLSGYAEIYKHALIFDDEYWKLLQKYPPLNNINTKELNEIIYSSVEIKKKVVEQDPFEKNIRKILNFGHTIGHAVETYFLERDEKPLLHGEAIIVGMICESYLSSKFNGLSEESLKDIISTFGYSYQYRLIPKSAHLKILSFIKNDKKNIAKENNFTFLNKIGDSKINCTANKEEIIDALNFYNKTVI